MIMKTRRNVIIFIIITFASGWLGVLLDAVLNDQPEGNSLGMGLFLVLPFLTGIILRITCRDSRDMGIKPNFKGNSRWYLLSIIIYPLVTVITVGVAKTFRYVDISDFEINTFISLALFSIAGGFVKNIFEEFAWRGYLTPKLIDLKLNDWFVYIISGLVWALWHAPYYLVFLPDVYFQSISRVGMLLTGCILMVCWAVMYVEIYRLTKSVWPCVIMHVVEDAVPTVLVATGAFITFTKDGDFWWNPISGISATILFLGLGFLLRTARIKKERVPQTYKQ